MVRHVRRFFLWLALSVPFFATMGAAAGQQMLSRLNADLQERTAQLIQNVLGPYRGEATVTNGLTISSVTYSNIEAAFREASRLMPDRLDLRFGIASALIGQATQTNTQFDLKMKSALHVYQEIRALDTNGFQAALLYAGYTRAIGETNESESAIAQLQAGHRERTRPYPEKFQSIDEILRMKLDDNPPKFLSMSRNHGIVVFGAALETNGTLRPKQIGRLRQGLELARLNPEAPIIVSGGNPRNGITEAYAMSHWFMNEGISTNRLYLEDQSRDTVGNAIYSCALLQKLGITQVTLVTSASHLKRALAIFLEASLQRGLNLRISHLVSKDDSTVDESRERVAIYRDVLRASGIWAFPGIQR
ncbi:MAG: hypothetical protein JWM99_4704 [Verrucomicrobiales bacterium]|nr:hypothetical protein [Verrucomicrobiales bacterium]